MSRKPEHNPRKAAIGIVRRVMRWFLKPVALAGLLSAVVVVWMASGAVLNSDAQENQASEAKEAPSFTVGVRRSNAKEMTRAIVIQGALEPARSVMVRAEVAGKVEAILARKGEKVKAGDPIARLAANDRTSLLAKAKAQFAQADRDYQAAVKLGRSGYATESRLATLKAQLEIARAAVETAELAVRHLTIRAPYAGVLNALPIEIGKYIAVGDEVAAVVEVDPITAVVYVAQHDVAQIHVGNSAHLQIVTVATVTGKIRFVSAEADKETRSFRVEIDIPNPDGRLRAGASVEVSLPVETLKAHFISPQYLTLGEVDKSGKRGLGVKIVDADDVVRFRPIRIVEAKSDGAWVAGLPNNVRLIVRGHAFVEAGQKVATASVDERASRLPVTPAK